MKCGSGGRTKGPRRREPQGRAQLQRHGQGDRPSWECPREEAPHLKPRTTGRDYPARGTLKRVPRCKGSAPPRDAQTRAWDRQPGPQPLPGSSAPRAREKVSREGRAQPLLVQGSHRVAGGAGLRARNRYPEGGTFAGPKHRSLGTTRFQGPSGPRAEGTAPATRADAHKGRAGDGSRRPGTQAREPAPASGGTARPLTLGTRGGRRVRRAALPASPRRF